MIGQNILQWICNKLAELILARLRNESSLISKAARFVCCEMIEGDYLEFGIYQGASYIDAYYSLKRQFERRSALNITGEPDHLKRRRQILWENMRFFAFDSYKGLPALSGLDNYTCDFVEGMYACSVNAFRKNIEAAKLPAHKCCIVEGWFKDTCIASNIQKLGLRKASIIWIDADLYSSTRSILTFITDLLQDGTVIIFDDWFSHKGNPQFGEQKAFEEWVKSAAFRERFVYQEFQREAWKRMSFIVSLKSEHINNANKLC